MQAGKRVAERPEASSRTHPTAVGHHLSFCTAASDRLVQHGRVFQLAPGIFDGKAIGAGWEGGVNGNGTLWSFDIGSQVFTKLDEFNYTDGYHPNGGIVVRNGTIFGTTKEGGANGDGTIWSFAVPEPSSKILTLWGCLGVLLLAERLAKRW
jgi:hypothetical protein